MRIGTWNLAGRWDGRHLELLRSMDCDVLLLTEVSTRVELPGYALHRAEGLMATKRHWAAVAARSGLLSLRDPHGASAMAQVEGLRVCSSILPWRSSRHREPWVGTSTAEKTAHAVAAIEAARPEVWGGDWNHSLSGREYTGAAQGRRYILDAVGRLGLEVASARLPHRIDGLLSIDHISVPMDWVVTSADRISAIIDRSAISDHDAYIVTAEPRPVPTGRHEP